MTTVNRHDFNLDDDVMQEVIDGWEIPDVEVFADELAPICSDAEAGERTTAAVALLSRRRVARNAKSRQVTASESLNWQGRRGSNPRPAA